MTDRDERLPPAPLPPGTSLAGIPEREVQERAQFVSELFQYLCRKVNDFVASGCRVEDDEELRLDMSVALQLQASILPDARAWRENREPAVCAAIKNGALDGRPEDVPDVILATIWCDVAFESEKAFWEALRLHTEKLKDVEQRRSARDS
jgi:hypothetical protein